MRKILLLEPKYKNKYPPIGLMKIATYHRILGDEVSFFKGDVKDLVLDQLTEECIEKFNNIDNSYKWNQKKVKIREYIKLAKGEVLKELNLEESKYEFLLINCISSLSKTYRKRDYARFPKWDRIYVTTLFTFYWKVTVEAIHYAKLLVKHQDQIMVGGVLASLLSKELEFETDIKPHEGLLDKPGILDPEDPKAKDLIIDDLPLDYSILDEIEYEYPTGSAYFTFMTKGCTRKCAFCSVPILEPTYKSKVDTIDKFHEIKEKYGEQQNLLLMDNNVLASPKFPEIIQEIKDMGFYKGATYIEPNQLEISVKNLKNGLNDKAYIKRSFKLLHEQLKRLRGKNKQLFYNILDKYKLLNFNSVTKEGIITSYNELKDIYERYRPKNPKLRYVDFNQGTDARYVTDELMKLMSEIPIRPLRIAFDYIGLRKQYENAVRLAAKYGITELSNYILYNFKDKPEDLYHRIHINVELSQELGIEIYSFPMKYIPLFGEEAKNRFYIGQNWNRKYIRAIQSILNVTKGIVASGQSFFEKAFGKNEDEFFEILHMPEQYIIYRYFFEGEGLTDEWRQHYRSLNTQEKEFANKIIRANDFSELEGKTDNPSILKLLSHYKIKKEDVEKGRKVDVVYIQTKKLTLKKLKEDRFIDLTLTYDFEAESI